MNALVETSAIHKTYHLGETPVPVLRGIDIRIERGEFVALMGPSGCGKSTLMHILGCLDRPTSGGYLLDGRETGNLSDNQRAALRNTYIGFVFQSFHLLNSFTALENVALPLFYRKSSGDWENRCRQALKRVGVFQRAAHRPLEMSGGEQQRVAIARALVTEPQLVLADEPTGNLDSTSGEGILELLKDLCREGTTLLMVTHDPHAASIAKRILYMRDGQLTGQEMHHAAG